MKTLRVLCILFLFALTALAQQKPSVAETVVLRGGKLLTITMGVIENGVIVIQDGKIAAVGKSGEVSVPKGARIIDVTGMTVYPGLIDSESRIGLTEIEAADMTNDLSEPQDNIMPHMHVADAFHAESVVIPVTRLNGVTNAVVAPSDENSLPGQTAFVQLAGRTSEDMLLVRDLALPLNFTGEQRRNSSYKSSKFPFTRMGMAAQLRQAFIDAQEYQQKWDDYQKSPSAKEGEADEKQKSATPPKRDLKLEALLPYLRGEKPIVLAAEEPRDILTALRFAREFKLKVILNHVTHSQPVLDEIAAAKLPVIVGPIYEDPRDDQRYDLTFRLPAELHKRGVKIAFASYDAHQSRNLPYQAGYAVAFGLPYEEALRAITINAAEIWGLAGSLGSLDVGKVANIVVANGDPLDVKTDVKHVFIAGKQIPMESHQTRLRDQYWPAAPKSAR